MREKLTVSDLSPYLSYQLLCNVVDFEGKLHEHVELTAISTIASYEALAFIENEDMPGELSMIHIEQVKPLLIPLNKFSSNWMSDTVFDEWLKIKKSTYFGFEALEYDTKYDNLLLEFVDHTPVYSLTYEAIPLFRFLYKNHIDVFGLIDKGLAVSKLNTKL